MHYFERGRPLLRVFDLSACIHYGQARILSPPRACVVAMRLLKCLPNGGFGLTFFDDDSTPPYAILSHTWIEGQEITYTELLAGTGAEKDGYAKIRFCGERAAKDGLEYFWVDTCCIDKSRNDELSTAINSMFRWYQRAARCYVYLSDVSVPDEAIDAQTFRISWEHAFRQSRWFTRGWTLQELLAPASVEFFSHNGSRLGTRVSLEQEIHDVTGIPSRVLRGRKLSDFSVDERMNWTAKRNTTLKEDKVYCLLGIFGVFLPLIYGEGEEYAALRLKDEIEKRQQGQGKIDIQDLPGLSLLDCVIHTQLNTRSFLGATVPPQRALCWPRESASGDRTYPLLVRYPPTHDNIRTGRLRKIRTCA